MKAVKNAGYYCWVFIFGGLTWLIGCNADHKQTEKLFKLKDAEETHVDFTNHLDFMGKFNIYTYRNFYNGGGVGLADINNDGLLDIYFVSNMHPNKLYLNKGNMVFEDITAQSGVGGTHAWSTGVSMADVNGDGWIDIYVCNSGEIEGDSKRNELFINHGDLTFTDEAASYGLDDPGYSIHGAFFDYDKDNDLDLYLGNNSYKAIGSFDLRNNKRTEVDSLGGDRLYRNDGGKFTNVTTEANIYSSIIGFALGVTVGDLDLDGWQDIYVSNDFFERDYIYLNQHDGTFKEVLTDEMKSISAASMGADIGDINNDMYPDIFATDMLPQSNARMKTVTTFENWDKYQENLENGYYHQFTRNMLHLNNGDGTFSEIGRLAGVQSTDWSWGALIFDMDNDGRKDLFVANGIFQDLTDQDYLRYFSNREVVKSIVKGKDIDYKKLIAAIPSMRLSNFAFQNEGDYHFENRAADWGLDKPSFSNGSSYGDLDNDGDLDLVVNNVNMPAFIFENESRQQHPENSFLRVELRGLSKNPFAVGAKVIARVQGKTYYTEQMPIRGYESTIDHRLTLGLGETDIIDSLIVIWPDGRMTLQKQLPTNQVISLRNEDAAEAFPFLHTSKKKSLFSDVSDNVRLPFVHKENDFIDFKRERLIFHMISSEGPRMCAADVNGDGLQDVYVGGAKDSPGALLLQQKSGKFINTNQALFEHDKLSEDIGAVFFDADNDGDQDLYVNSGSIELPNSSSGLIDRLYFNDGNGKFIKSDQILPSFNFESTSCVQPYDLDVDGDIDLFVGVRSRPFLYGAPVSGYLLDNDGHGHFTDITDRVAPGLRNIGMITDARWVDIDHDQDQDLVLCGEYMPVTVFENNHGSLENKTAKWGLAQTNGWWNALEVADLDNDGDMDLVVGNHGLNSMFKATSEEPVQMYVNDFDLNGSVDHLVCVYKNHISYPFVLKHDLLAQMPGLGSKYMNYKRFKNQTMDSIFTPKQLEKALVLNAYEMRSCVLLNAGDSTFVKKPLPVEAQFSPVYALLVRDFDQDGIPDILLGGNLDNVKPEVGRYDASYGTFLKGMGEGNYRYLAPKETGFRIRGQARDMLYMHTSTGNLLWVARNNDSIQVFEVH